MAEENEQFVTYELEGAVALIGLDRASKRNAINDKMVGQISEAVVRAHNEARAAVVFAHGPNFSAGLDLAEAAKWMSKTEQAHGPSGLPRRREGWHRVFDQIARGPIPFVGALHGAVIGGGLELAAALHVRVADATAFFALPEGQRGIFVGGGGTVRIQRLMGYARMADLMLTGRVLTPEEGERANLTQYVVPAGEDLSRAKSLAARIAQNAPNTNWAICNVLPRINDMSHDDGLFVESLVGANVRSQESAERLDAFVHHRAPRLVEPGTSGDGLPGKVGQAV
jgi:enoyl-CoA hydratase/carnithine racemase